MFGVVRDGFKENFKLYSVINLFDDELCIIIKEEETS